MIKKSMIILTIILFLGGSVGNVYAKVAKSGHRRGHGIRWSSAMIKSKTRNINVRKDWYDRRGKLRHFYFMHWKRGKIIKIKAVKGK